MNADNEYRSGFVALVGRPNAGKSTLLNKILGTKVSIVSDKPQTTRTQITGVLNRQRAQLVFIDTPGMHKPRSALGKSLNNTAKAASSQVDVVCFLLDGSAPYGSGDAAIASTLPTNAVILVTKTDICSPQKVLQQLASTSHLNVSQWFPMSGKTGDGIEPFLAHLEQTVPKGPRLYPEGMVTDVSEEIWLAELVREQLLAITRAELPYSIATRVTEVEGTRIRCEILVERESQKAMVIGSDGELLKAVGIAVRQQLAGKIYLELVVKVEKNWQRHPALVKRLGY